MNEDGSEHLYYTDINQPVVNFGVSVLASSAGALIDPFVLGSKDENDVQGYTGTPTDVNGLTFDANIDIGAAGVQFPRLQRFFVSVDSRADAFTNRSQKGQYLLNSWVERPDAAGRSPPDDARHGGPPADRRAGVRPRRRRRPAVARHQLQPRARRRVAVRPARRG